jgi:cytochrome P450
MRAYRDNPSIRANVVNELARLNPVELILTRFPTEDIEIHGVTIPAGSSIKFPVGAANRDPEIYTNPNDFDYNRPPEASRNLTFGLGTHACAGQLLARAETEAILTLIAERYTSVELAGPAVEVRTDRLVAFDKLPVVLH